MKSTAVEMDWKLDTKGRNKIDCGAGVTRLEANADDIARLDALRSQVKIEARKIRS